jgi:hypothetical protein
MITGGSETFLDLKKSPKGQLKRIGSNVGCRSALAHSQMSAEDFNS